MQNRAAIFPQAEKYVMAYLTAQFLFLLFINDLLLNIRGAKVVLFADGTNLLITGKDECFLQQKLTKVMRDAETWFQKVILS
jgi:hypothetical protein